MGANRIKKISLLTVAVKNCKEMMRRNQRNAIDEAFHGCAQALFFDETGAVVRKLGPPKPRIKRFAINDSYKNENIKHRSLNTNEFTHIRNRTKRHEWINSEKWLDEKWLVDKPSWWGSGPYFSYGPTYGDYGGPLMCYEQQVGVFAFPLHNHDKLYPECFSVWTGLDRHIKWMDSTILENTEKRSTWVKEYNDSISTEPSYSDIWDEFGFANCISVYNIIIWSNIILLLLM